MANALGFFVVPILALVAGDPHHFGFDASSAVEWLHRRGMQLTRLFIDVGSVSWRFSTAWPAQWRLVGALDELDARLWRCWCVVTKTTNDAHPPPRAAFPGKPSPSPDRLFLRVGSEQIARRMTSPQTDYRNDGDGGAETGASPTL